MQMRLVPWLESRGLLFCAGCLSISGVEGFAMLRGAGATLRNLFTGMWIVRWASKCFQQFKYGVLSSYGEA